jgi:hypothetical protein
MVRDDQRDIFHRAANCVGLPFSRTNDLEHGFDDCGLLRHLFEGIAPAGAFTSTEKSPSGSRRVEPRSAKTGDIVLLQASDGNRFLGVVLGVADRQVVYASRTARTILIIAFDVDSTAYSVLNCYRYETL